jgi:hypothetical protein
VRHAHHLIRCAWRTLRESQMIDKDQYKVQQEPFYQQQRNEVALY